MYTWLLRNMTRLKFESRHSLSLFPVSIRETTFFLGKTSLSQIWDTEFVKWQERVLCSLGCLGTWCNWIWKPSQTFTLPRLNSGNYIIHKLRILLTTYVLNKKSVGEISLTILQLWPVLHGVFCTFSLTIASYFLISSNFTNFLL